MSENEAYLCLSAAGDFSVSQVVDVVEGVHCTIRQRDLAWPGQHYLPRTGRSGTGGGAARDAVACVMVGPAR